ncbi:FAD binding domain-containing protein [Limobrevibacterium gyesilva]|uniref:Xanthine dehydrogenase family protein subunit M n=1 Tax=Limobrevibacterium gyesilva TaxID=2991712 RepID=A0AA41YKW4_9PROT|nr:xanthine dehydrogenase family protein subunit M [Limobrevibacterium gyesilva]MCW3473773.1 xanthine dehydrogenase family protein subunit M [Limobrevibacterium gyesilva]
MYDFAYQKPASLADAVKALGAEDAKALAGGQTLIPVLKQRLNKPSVVVDLSRLGLSGISLTGETVTIGAMTTHATVANSADVKRAIPALAHLASLIGDEQVRHRGTIGGSLANNDPSADYPAAVLALGATIKTDRRTIAADDYFQGMFATALEPNEVITSVTFPIPAKAAYMKFNNPASRYAMVGVFVAKGPQGVRVAITGAGQGGVFRHAAYEAALAANWSADALNGITTPTDGLNSDIHASAEYRAHLIGVMAKRATAAAG